MRGLRGADMRREAIEHFDAAAVFRGLLDGDDFGNRVAGSCIYGCPRCAHRIRFRWRSFFQAKNSPSFRRRMRRAFDDLTPKLEAGEPGLVDFFCPGCRAPTRIVFRASPANNDSYHFDIYAALVGEGKAAR